VPFAAVEEAPACSGGLTGGEGAVEGATAALDSILQRACDILVRAIRASHGAKACDEVCHEKAPLAGNGVMGAEKESSRQYLCFRPLFV